MSARARLCLALLAVSGGAVGSWLLLGGGARAFGWTNAPATTGIGHVAVGYAFTLVGVYLGTGYRELQDRRNRGQKKIRNLPGFLSGVFRSVDFWIGVFGAPIVFGLVLQTVGGASLPGFLAIAIENGFCCSVVVAGLVARKVHGGVELKENTDQEARDASRLHGSE